AAGAPGGIAAAAVCGTGAPAAAARSAIAARTFDQRTLEYLIHRSYSRLPPGYPSDIRLPAAPYSLTRPPTGKQAVIPNPGCKGECHAHPHLASRTGSPVCRGHFLRRHIHGTGSIEAGQCSADRLSE